MWRKANSTIVIMGFCLGHTATQWHATGNTQHRRHSRHFVVAMIASWPRSLGKAPEVAHRRKIYFCSGHELPSESDDEAEVEAGR